MIRGLLWLFAAWLFLAGLMFAVGQWWWLVLVAGSVGFGVVVALTIRAMQNAADAARDDW